MASRLPHEPDPPPRPAGAEDAAEPVPSRQEPLDLDDPGSSARLYEDLCALASRYMAREHKGHTLGTTALAHEAFLKLHGDESEDWTERGRVLAAASGAMRRILIDHARRKGRRRDAFGSLVQDARGEELSALLSPGGPPVDPGALDRALEELARQDPRRARVVELRFFGGCKVAEIARELGLSTRTVFDDWVYARAWLRRRLQGDGGGVEGEGSTGA